MLRTRTWRLATFLIFLKTFSKLIILQKKLKNKIVVHIYKKRKNIDISL